MASHPLPFTFGILGNIICFLVFLSPIPTFYRVYRKKSTEGFQSVPYVVALFSCLVRICYALVKTNSTLLITVNSFGCFMETIYITVYLKYATKKPRIFTVTILVLNVVAIGVILLVTRLLFKGPTRVAALGWICVAYSVSVFAAPLGVIGGVIRTKSVEFMPFYLSFSLTMSALAWFGYGFVTHDLYVLLPSILGFVFGAVQMVLYMFYRKKAATAPEVAPEAATAPEVAPEHKFKNAAAELTPTYSEKRLVYEENTVNGGNTNNVVNADCAV